MQLIRYKYLNIIVLLHMDISWSAPFVAMLFFNFTYTHTHLWVYTRWMLRIKRKFTLRQIIRTVRYFK